MISTNGLTEHSSISFENVISGISISFVKNLYNLIFIYKSLYNWASDIVETACVRLPNYFITLIPSPFLHLSDYPKISQRTRVTSVDI